MTIGCTSFTDDLFDFDDIHISTSRKIREEQYNCSKNAIKTLTDKHLHKAETLCTLDQVYNALISKGVNTDCCQYLKNDFSECLDINLDDTEFKLSIQLFPNRNPKKGITLIVSKVKLHETVDSYVTPEGLADFILGIYTWLPEYYEIEVRILEEELQKKTIRDMATDLLKRNIGGILEEKGYSYTVYSSAVKNKASLTITISDIFTMTLEIDLMEDFLNQVKRVVESLPVNDIEK